MKVLIVLCVIASALAYPRPGRDPRVAFIEEIRSKSDSRIIQGYPAEDGQIPYQAFLYTADDKGSRYVCGGSLISSSWVVTAGHCLYGLTQAEVRLGSVDYNTAPVIISTRDVIVHPRYNPDNINNDIALIGLGQDVQFTANISPVRILTNLDTYVGRKATVSGFGLTENWGTVSDTLNWVDVEIITNAKCIDSYGDEVIISSTICATGYENNAQGSCSGDSGGPLTISDDGGDILIGIVSFGASIGCDSSIPNGYTRPNYFTSWITSETGIQFSAN